MRETAQLNSILQTVSQLSQAQLVQRLRKFAATTSASVIFKQAAIGGDPDGGFEQSFASLGYTFLSDKAPGLLDYMVGFQLVDRNEDNTKAVGVFGFNVGGQWMFAPVFFLSGDMKGHELLYLKNQDMFVPLKENWINFLINKKPQVLGEGTGQNMQQLGVMQPNLQNMIFPPFGGKYAAARRPWSKNAELFERLPRLYADPYAAEHADAFFGGTRQVKSALDLRSLLEAGGLPYVSAAVAVVNAWPGVKEAMDKHYGPGLLPEVIRGLQKQAMDECCDSGVLKKKKTVPVPPSLPVNSYKRRKGVLKQSVAEDPENPSVDKTKIITENTPELNEEEQQRLLRDGHLIKDERKGEEFTQEYNTQQPMTLANPDITGVYEVLTKAGDFEKCLVLFQPYSDSGRHQYVTVVRLGDSKGWKNLHPSKVYVRQGSGESPNQDGKLDWYEDLPDGSESLSEDGTYIVVTAGGSGTTPFRVYKSLDGGAYEVSWHDSGNENPEYLEGAGVAPYGGDSYYDWAQPTIFLGKRKGSTILREKKNLYVPENSKIIKLKDPPKPSEDGCCSPISCETDPAPIQPGEPQDLQLALRQKTSELKVIDDNCELIVNGQRLSKKAALFHLVLDHGLSETDACRLVKEAALYHGVRWRVKYAASYPREKRAFGPEMMGGFPPPSEGGSQFMGPYMGPESYSGSDMPFVGAPMQQPYEAQMTVPGLEAGMTDPNIYNPMMVQDPMALQTAQQATQTGQKEVFDTAMMSQLTKMVHPEQAVDKDLGNIAKTLNTLGKMLFMFYWHNEEFSDRYGKAKLPELEDTLRNAFEMLGDLLLFLRQDTTDQWLGGGQLGNFGPNLDAAGHN